MLKLFKNMRRREVLMALLCFVLVIGQVYFDLRLPDYMTELTTLIKTTGETAEIARVGFKMLGCTLISAVFAVACGYLAARTASDYPYHKRYYPDSDDCRNGNADGDQSADYGGLGAD